MTTLMMKPTTATWLGDRAFVRWLDELAIDRTLGQDWPTLYADFLFDVEQAALELMEV